MTRVRADTVELRPFADADYRLLPGLFALLEPQIDSAIVLERMTAMRAQGWRCLGAFAGQEIVAMAGYSKRQHLFSGLVAYVENLVVVPDWRGRGVGERLMRWIEDWARAEGCTMVTLDAYAVNLAAREFYARLAYDPRGVHFVHELV
jgi:GNAT superfamily N-acetyltransferase